MIEIIAEGADTFAEQVKASIEQHISGDVVLVNALFMKDKNGNRSDFEGVQIGLDLARTGKKVIVWGPVTADQMLGLEQKRNQDYFAILNAMPNAAYVEVPTLPSAFIAAANELLEGKKVGNPAVVASGLSNIRERKISSLRHSNVDYGRQPANPEEFLREAKELGFTGSVEAVREALRVWERTTAGAFAGQSFPGLFVDVQGTLVDSDGNLNDEVVKLAAEGETDGPVTVWTDGDLPKIVPQLRKLGVRYPVVSKFDFNGATVQRAIDDKPLDEFVRLYGVTAGSFLQV